MRKYLILFSLLLLVCGCNETAESPNFNDGTGGQDNISPGPTPGPTPPAPGPTPAPPTVETKTLNFKASDLNPEDAVMVYKKRVKPTQLGTPVDDEDCHNKYKDRCIKDRQVLFQFNIEEINERFPADLWDVVEFKLEASFFSVSGDISNELLCLLNRKVCSGVEIKKLGGIRLPFLWRNSKFWTGLPREHVLNRKFDQVLRSGINSNGVAVLVEESFNLIELFSLTPKTLLTTIRKNKQLHFSVSSDTYVEDPELTISLKRRLLSQ